MLTPDGRLDKGAILKDARRQFLTMGRHGWDWRQCVRYSWARARAKATKERDGTAKAMDAIGRAIASELEWRHPIL